MVVTGGGRAALPLPGGAAKLITCGEVFCLLRAEFISHGVEITPNSLCSQLIRM